MKNKIVLLILVFNIFIIGINNNCFSKDKEKHLIKIKEILIKQKKFGSPPNNIYEFTRDGILYTITSGVKETIKKKGIWSIDSLKEVIYFKIAHPTLLENGFNELFFKYYKIIYEDKNNRKYKIIFSKEQMKEQVIDYNHILSSKDYLLLYPLND